MNLLEYLSGCRELAQLCTQNGWIDDETVRVEVLEGDDSWLLVAVTFEEVLMEGSGCVAGRVPCYGRMRIRLDERGDVCDLEVL